jgi:hypothetical protein
MYNFFITYFSKQTRYSLLKLKLVAAILTPVAVWKRLARDYLI